MLFRSIFNIGFLTMLSRVSGFVRDVCISAFLGAGPVTDAFFVALKMPNLFRRLFAEGAFSVSFVPIYSGYLAQEKMKEAEDFAGKSFALLILFLTPFTILMTIFMPEVLHVTAPGFLDEPDKFEMAVEFSRITFVYLFFIGIVAFMGSLLNSHHFFGPFAASSIIFNIMIVVGLFAGIHMGWMEGKAMAWSLSISGVVQVIWMLYHCLKHKIVIKFQKPSFSPEIKRLLRLMGPGALGTGVMQINIFVDTILASLLPSGAISYLFYADRLNQLPLGIIGVAMGTALLPYLSQSHARGDHKESFKYIDESLLYGLVLSLPAAVALLVIPETILLVLFERGKFTSYETAQTAKAVLAYSIGIPAYVLSKVYTSACFARSDTKTPVIIASMVAVGNVVLAYSLIHVLGHMGIALATGIVAWVNVYMLSWALKRKMGYQISFAVKKKLFLVFLSALVMGGSLYGLNFLLQPWFMGSALFKIISLSLLIFMGVVIYLLCCMVFRIFTLHQLGVLRSHIQKRKAV